MSDAQILVLTLVTAAAFLTYAFVSFRSDFADSDDWDDTLRLARAGKAVVYRKGSTEAALLVVTQEPNTKYPDRGMFVARQYIPADTGPRYNGGSWAAGEVVARYDERRRLP